MTNVLFAHDRSLGLEYEKLLIRKGYCVSPIDISHQSGDDTLDEICRNIGTNDFDIMFVDGLFAYRNKLRTTLNKRGLDDKGLPLLVGYYLFSEDVDKGLSVSGCDFGKLSIDSLYEELTPETIIQTLTQDPIPKTDGLLFNPSRYEERDGLVLPIES
ncbi:hypothetical protein GOV12_04870 [Candidatus Pacearchaeota archaeon]|nr:hypothetical protein [Candidatus Pacearchaeota archaeon]